jgi:hypothetical protein
LNFLNIAAGSATEARYLADVSRRLGYFHEKDVRPHRHQALT